MKFNSNSILNNEFILIIRSFIFIYIYTNQGKLGYGKKNKNCKVQDQDMKKFYNLSIFDEANPQEHQQKLMTIFGAFMGFRGGEEHWKLERSQIGSGFFPDDHEIWPGGEWWGVTSMGEFKTHQLSMECNYVFEWEDFGKFPVLSDGVNGNVDGDIGGAIKRWMKKCPVSEKTDRFYRKCSDKKIFPNNTLGKDKVRLNQALAFKKLGIENWKELRPHSMRGWFITQLANNPNINNMQTSSAARHKDVSTTLRYQSTTSHSKNQMLLALTNRGGGDTSSAVASKPSPPPAPAESIASVDDDCDDENLYFDLDTKPASQPTAEFVDAQKMPPPPPRTFTSRPNGMRHQYEGPSFHAPPMHQPEPYNNYSSFTQMEYNNVREELQHLRAYPEPITPAATRSNDYFSQSSHYFTPSPPTNEKYSRFAPNEKYSSFASNENYSSFTQHAYNNLSHEMRHLHISPPMNRSFQPCKRMKNASTSFIPQHSGPTHYDPFYRTTQQYHLPSAREQQYKAMGDELKYLREKKEIVKRNYQMQMRRFEERALKKTSPWKNDKEEEDDLYLMSLSHEKEKELDALRMRQVELQMKWQNIEREERAGVMAAKHSYRGKRRSY